jgi:hypothetical protein
MLYISSKESFRSAVFRGRCSGTVDGDTSTCGSCREFADLLNLSDES